MLHKNFTMHRKIHRKNDRTSLDQSLSGNGALLQDWIREVDTIAGLEPVLVGYLTACVLDRIVLPGVRVLRMLENSSRGFHPEVETT